MSEITNYFEILNDNTGRTRLAPYVNRVQLYCGKAFSSAIEKQVYLQLLMASVSMKNMPSLEELGALSGNENAEVILLAISKLVKCGAISILDKPFNEKRRIEKIYSINDIFSI